MRGLQHCHDLFQHDETDPTFIHNFLKIISSYAESYIDCSTSYMYSMIIE